MIIRHFMPHNHALYCSPFQVVKERQGYTGGLDSPKQRGPEKTGPRCFNLYVLLEEK